jgi:ADP-ribose pyrophosphatase
MEFQVTGSQTVFRGKAFDVRQDELRMPEGKTARLDIVEHERSVSLVPVDGQGQVWFVRQYRHPAGRVLLELPAGVLNRGEDPEASAQRELREEIGMAAGNLQKLGEFYLAPGYSTELMFVYLATDLKADALPADEDEFISIEKIPVDQVFGLAEAGELEDAKSLAALLLARPYLFPG